MLQIHKNTKQFEKQVGEILSVFLFQPNDFKKPKELDLRIVTHQVRYLGSVALSKHPRNY